MLGLSLLLLFFTEKVVSVTVAERSSIEESASNELLYDAEILARNLDGLLRIADALLSDESESLSRSDPKRASAVLAAIASRLPESQNAYLLDRSGAVLSTAWPRQRPRLDLSPDRAERLVSVGGSQTLIVRAEAEGGAELAITRSLHEGTETRLAAVLFSSSVLEGRIRLLKEPGEGVATIVDVSGATLAQKEAAALPALSSGGAPTGSASRLLSVETALETYPIRIRIQWDIGPAIAAWRTRLVWQTGLEVALLLLVAAVTIVALSSRRRARRAAELERKLAAEELLFHEINHRVKNNLAIVQSILSLGAEEAEEHPERAEGIIRAAAERVQSMTLLHEQLYRRRSLERVDFGVYLSDLAAALAESYASGDRIAIAVDAADGCMLELGTAVPLALIVTELVTNAFKHAFPGQCRGRILLAARPTPEGRFRVEVADDGVGYGSAGGGGGFGHVLVEALVAQLGAVLAYSPGEGGRGLRCRVEFLPQKVQEAAQGPRSEAAPAPGSPRP